MKFKLAIANTIEFPVALHVRDGGAVKAFKFHIQATRIDADRGRKMVTQTPDSEETVDQFLLEVITGWRGQTLLIDEDDKPVDYSADALRALLSLPGAGVLLYRAYLQELVATDTAEGRRKN